MTQHDTLTLEPCPFCGKSHTPKLILASEYWDDEYDGDYPHSESYAVMCDASSPNGPGGCGASGGFHATEDEAVDAWNSRAALSATQPAQAEQSEACPTCGESDPRTGSCGTSDSDTRALCKRKQAAQGAEADFDPLTEISRLVAVNDDLRAKNIQLLNVMAAQGAGEVVAWQHQKPIEGPTGEIEGYTDWMDGDGLPWWPRRALYTHPTPPPAQPAPVVPDAPREISCALALFPVDLESQTFRVNSYNQSQVLEADGDTQFFSKKKVMALLEKLHGHLTAAATPTPPAQAAADARDAERYRALKARHSYLIVCRLIGESGYSSHKASEIIDAYADSAVSDVRAHDSMTPEQRQQELQDEFDAALATHQQRQDGGAPG